MKKQIEERASEEDKGRVIGREAFAKISAVEGIELSDAAKAARSAHAASAVTSSSWQI